MPVFIEGLTELERDIQSIKMRLPNVMREFAFDFSNRIKTEAQRSITNKGAVDTGALRQSVAVTNVKNTPTEVEYHIIAGRDDVRRGEGTFARSQKTGEKVSLKPTSQYAAAVEFYNKRYYMKDGLAMALKQIQNQLRLTIKRLIG